MELKEGMYVKNKYGLAKIIKIENNEICDVVTFDKNICFACDCKTHKELIDKPLSNILPITKDIDINKLNVSKNIIDLIEVGDYVNGERVVAIHEHYVWDEEDIGTALETEHEYTAILNEDIKSVVTKEQFELMKYEVK